MTPAQLRKALEQKGIILLPNAQVRETANMAYDAADLSPTLVGVNNAGIPNFLTTLIDTEVINALFSPMTATEIVGETKKGDFTTLTAAFIQSEPTTRVATYGDYSNEGNSAVNINYPQRQSYHFQTWSKWGERQLEMAGAGRISYAAEVDYAATLGLAKFLNSTYLLGVGGLQNYGLMNDPNLPTPVAATVNWTTAEPEDISNSVVALFERLIRQTQGLVKQDMDVRLAMAPTCLANLNRVNIYGLSASKLLKDTYPNMKFISVPEFDTAGGRLVQLWAPNVEGHATAQCGFTEKLRNHAIERYSSYFQKKNSAGTWGAIVFRPSCMTQLLGV